MASNILSRLLPSAGEDPERNTPPRLPDEESGDPDLDHVDDARFEDQDLAQLLAEGMEDDMPVTDETHSTDERDLPRRSIKRPSASDRASRAIKQSSKAPISRSTDDEDEVPASLLLGGASDRRRKRKSLKGQSVADLPTMPIPGPDTRASRAQWETTRAQQQLHSDVSSPPPVQPIAGNRLRPQFAVNSKEKAMWAWVNVGNLDNHLTWVYRYYEQHGIWSHLLDKTVRYVTAIFVVWLSTFMFYCIDYSKLPGSTKFEQVRVPHCTEKLPWYWNLFIWGFVISLVYKIASELQAIPRWLEMHNFYTYLLDIPDKDIQTVSWQYVVSKVMELRDAHPQTAHLSPANRRWLATQSKQRMDAHDIANRLMRRENYYIAMINKDILDFSVNIPFIGRKDFYPPALQYLVSLCLMDCVFDDHYQVKETFRTTRNRKENIILLQRRFNTCALISMVFVIPLAITAVLLRFLESYTEYQKNPSTLSTRKFSHLAEWKIRDFNEVTHLFDRRKRLSYAFANRYLDQFPKDKMNKLLRFVAFVMGSLAAILGIVTLIDPDLFLGFEIGGKTALFWLGIFSTLAVVCRNAATDEDDDLWDPEVAMNAVVAHTHYCPESWKGRLHSDEVRADFSSMYKLEAMLFIEDIIGTLLTPWILMYNLPSRSDRLVDFFREFTIHVDGLGTVCSYAMFDFKNGGKAAARNGQSDDLRGAYYGDKHNKMMESYLSFVEAYATNPKRGLHGRSRRTFLPPPTFPGLNNVNMNQSPSVLAEHHSGSVMARNPAALLRQSTLQSQAAQHTPRFGPAGGSGGHISPMHSILLDPHHQPRSSPRQAASVRPPVRASGRHALEGDPAEAEEHDSSQPQQAKQQIPYTPISLIEEDSELGESWLLRGGEGTDEAQRPISDKGQRGGVLGMLKELQKAQTEDRGGHI